MRQAEAKLTATEDRNFSYQNGTPANIVPYAMSIRAFTVKGAGLVVTGTALS